MTSPTDQLTELRAALMQDRLASYARLRGGFPIPLAGTVYWLAVAAGSTMFEPSTLLFYSFLGTGAIFPLALLFAQIFRNDFMKDQSAVSSVLVPTFISMLLFWPMVVAATMEGSADIALVILAIGMSLHWPVIGWSYGRTAIFCAHSIVRALLVIGLFIAFPDERFFFIPLAVAAIYLLTVIAIYIDSGAVRRNLNSSGAAA